MKKLILSAMLGLLVIGTTAPIYASAAEDWQCSLNPAGMWRENENGGKTTEVDHVHDAWASLDEDDNGPSAIKAEAQNSDGDARTSATSVTAGDGKTYLKNETMSGGYTYYLWCKNAKATASWVWATGSYAWDN